MEATVPPAVMPNRFRRSVLSLLWLSAAIAAQPAPTPARLGGDEFTYRRELGIPFVERDGRALHLDLWIPDTVGPHPTVVLFHGGAWRHGGRGLLDAFNLAQALVREGVAVASASYRLVPRATHPAQVEDAAAAYVFLQKEAERFGLDTARFAVMGASSGGHLASMVATRGSLRPDCTAPRCAVSISAPYDLVPDPSYTPTVTQVILVYALLGVTAATPVEEVDGILRERGADASPLRFVDRTDPPFLILDSPNDHLVPPWQGERMAKALLAHGVPCTRELVPTTFHCRFLIEDPRGWLTEPPPFWRSTRSFLREHLLPTTQPAGPSATESEPKSPRKR